jgi:hypothetical protein
MLKPSLVLVHSSDVISDMRVNVLEEGTERILWYKVRMSFARVIHNRKCVTQSTEKYTLL